MSAPPSLGFGLCRLVESSEDEEEVRDAVLSGVGIGRLNSSGWSSSPAQNKELVRATNRASGDSQRCSGQERLKPREGQGSDQSLTQSAKSQVS